MLFGGWTGNDDGHLHQHSWDGATLWYFVAALTGDRWFGGVQYWLQRPFQIVSQDNQLGITEDSLYSRQKFIKSRVFLHALQWHWLWNLPVVGVELLTPSSSVASWANLNLSTGRAPTTSRIIRPPLSASIGGCMDHSRFYFLIVIYTSCGHQHGQPSFAPKPVKLAAPASDTSKRTVTILCNLHFQLSHHLLNDYRSSTQPLRPFMRSFGFFFWGFIEHFELATRLRMSAAFLRGDNSPVPRRRIRSDWSLFYLYPGKISHNMGTKWGEKSDDRSQQIWAFFCGRRDFVAVVVRSSRESRGQWSSTPRNIHKYIFTATFLLVLSQIRMKTPSSRYRVNHAWSRCEKRLVLV